MKYQQRFSFLLAGHLAGRIDAIILKFLTFQQNLLYFFLSSEFQRFYGCTRKLPINHEIYILVLNIKIQFQHIMN